MSPETETLETYELTSNNVLLNRFEYDADGYAVCGTGHYWCAEKMMVDRDALGVVQPISVHHSNNTNVNAALDTMAAAIQAAVQTAYAAMADHGVEPRFSFTDTGPHLVAARRM